MNEENINQSKPLKVSFFVFLITVFILPIFFIPNSLFPLLLSKTLLISLGTSLSLLFFFIFFVKKRELALPRNLVFFSPITILLISLLSALSSGHKTLSVIGYGFEVGTLYFIFIFFSVFYLTILLFPKIKGSIGQAILFFVFVFIVLSAYQLLKVFGLDFLSFGIFTDPVATPLGNWNELALLSGAVLILSVFFLDKGNVKNKSGGKLLFLVSLILSLVMLIIVNFWQAWLLTFLVLLVFIFLQFFKTSNGAEIETGGNPPANISRKFLTFSLSILLISLVFISPLGGFITQPVNNFFDLGSLDVKPSFGSTLEVFYKTIKEDFTNFLIGSGPNSFLFQWRQWKPLEINQTEFWNSEFHYGVGLIPTFFVHTGVSGTLLWLFFIGSFFWFGFRYFIKNTKENFSTLFLFLSAYFWLVIILYPVSHTLFILTALFSGIFIASLLGNDKLKVLKFSFETPKRNIVLIAILAVFLVISLWGSFSILRKTFAVRDFNQGINSLFEGEVKEAEEKLTRAYKISSNDIIARYLSEVYLIESDNLAQNATNPSAEDISSFQELLQNAKNYAELSVIFNPRGFENWIQLGRFYEFLGALNVEGSEESLKSARMSYEGAQVFDPQNPILDLMLAKLEFSSGDLERSEYFINKALAKKSNYSEAIFILSRIKTLQGNLDEAIGSTEEIINLNPYNPAAYFQLGLLHYQKSEFKKAADVLNQAIFLEPQYANARYFLGLSLAQDGKSNEAIKHFEILKENYPQNSEVQKALESLNAGGIPFEDVEEVEKVEDQESEETLPIEED